MYTNNKNERENDQALLNDVSETLGLSEEEIPDVEDFMAYMNMLDEEFKDIKAGKEDFSF